VGGPKTVALTFDIMPEGPMAPEARATFGLFFFSVQES